MIATTSSERARVDVDATYGTWHADLIAVDVDKVTIETRHFGRLELPRQTVKAIRYAEEGC